MKHAREDYNRIQDPVGLIPEDEPVFLIRAQDQVGFMAVRAWAHQYRLNGGSDAMYETAMRWADKMEAWPVKKTADMPATGGAITSRAAARESGIPDPAGTQASKIL